MSELDFDNHMVRMWVNPTQADLDDPVASRTYDGTNWSTAVRVGSGATTTWDNLTVADNWNDLGPRPVSTISADEAIKAVQDCGGEAGPSATCEAELVWHLPQTQPIDAPLVLCWIVGPKGGNGDWRVWVDAGTGEIVDVAAMLN